MKAGRTTWLILFVLAVVLTVLSAFLSYLPGDVALTGLIQSALPESTAWAGYLSSAAKMPWLLALVGVTFCLSWWIAGWRAAALSLASVGVMWLLGTWLGPLIDQPRPSEDLIRVVGSHSGSAFPSQTALRYAATVGFLGVVAALRGSNLARWGLAALCTVLLLAAAAGRVAVGAHWPSDIAVSYLTAFLWIALLTRALPRPHQPPADPAEPQNVS